MSQHHPVNSPRFGGRRFSLGQLLMAGVACTVLGVGLGRVAAVRLDEPGAVDVGFARDMIDHHDQAVTMAIKLVHKPGIDPIVWNFAVEVLIFQRWETGIMDTYLDDWGRNRGALDRQAMTWMGMSTTVQQMPGMQSEAALHQLDEATGDEAARLFLTMMRDHHLGGVHMADYAATHASERAVRALAARMATNQRSEAAEYTVQLQRLGG